MKMQPMETPSYEELHLHVEAAPIAIMICSADQLCYANRSFMRLFGYEHLHELIGVDPINSFTAPEDREAFRSALFKLLSGGSEWEEEWLQAVRRNGSTFHAHLRLQGFRHSTGIRAFITIVDDTAQQEERRRLLLLSQAFDAVSEAIGVTDMSGRILYANRAAGKLFGAAPEALVGTWGPDLISPNADPAQVKYFRTRDRQEKFGELLLRKRTGEDFPAEIKVTHFDTPQGGGGCQWLSSATSPFRSGWKPKG